MADPKARLRENVPGEFYVDDSCIDCDTCRQIEPSVFARAARQQSYVAQQPGTEAARERSVMALVACPTSSIGTTSRLDAREAAKRFPEIVADEVYYCGFASASSYGASSYLIRRPEGNVLVDSPRAAGPLIERIEQLGGVDFMFLTHCDDVADHELFRRHFSCERILHAADVGSGTHGVERKLEGTEPIRLASDLLAIPVPGHTRGSVALLFRETFLFTGDHLWGLADGSGLRASRAVCWYSWPEQLRSVEGLLAYDFRWVLPGHGRRFATDSIEGMREQLGRLLSDIGPRRTPKKAASG